MALDRHDTQPNHRIKTLKQRVVVTDHKLVTFATTDKITTADNHNLALGDTVSFLAGTGGTLGTGISAATIYYAVPVYNKPKEFKVATSLANAIAGTVVDITAAGTAPNYANFGLIATETVALWTPNLTEDLVLKAMSVRCTTQVGTAGTAPQLTITANGVTLISATTFPVVQGKIRNLAVLTTDIDSSFDAILPLTLLLSTGAAGATGTTPTNTKLIYDIVIEAHDTSEL